MEKSFPITEAQLSILKDVQTAVESVVGQANLAINTAVAGLGVDNVKQFIRIDEEGSAIVLELEDDVVDIGELAP